MWFAIAVAGLTVRVDVLGVTSIVRALNLRRRLYTKLLDHFTAAASSLIGFRLCGRRLCYCCSHILCASMAGWCWSEMASKLLNAARKCRP